MTGFLLILLIIKIITSCKLTYLALSVLASCFCMGDGDLPSDSSSDGINLSYKSLKTLQFRRKSILYKRFGPGHLTHYVVAFFGAKFPQLIKNSCASSLATILVTVIVVQVLCLLVVEVVCLYCAALLPCQ